MEWSGHVSNTDETGHGEGSGDTHAHMRAQLGQAGRASSDAAVMFHTALGEKLGIGATDWKALGMLDQHGPMTAGEIGRLSGLAPASVTGVLTRLERKGYVRRRKDAQDGRRVVAELTDGLLRRSQPLLADYERRLNALMERFTAQELETIAGFLRAHARVQSEVTAELSAQEPAIDRM